MSTGGFIALGYVVSLPVVVYGIVDLARIPDRLYSFTTYSRRIWIAAIVMGYACFGFGGILMTAIWLRSSERIDLHEELTLDARWERPVGSIAGPTRSMRRRERRRRQRWAVVMVTLPVAFAVVATATRFS